MLHNKSIQKDPAILNVFNQLRHDLENKLSIEEFNNWTAAHPSVTSPILMLQLHLRLQIIGEAFWIKLSKDRKEHPEQGKLNYVRDLQTYVLEKNKLFRSRTEAIEFERRRLSRLG
jgi:hypothetical protein